MLEKYSGQHIVRQNVLNRATEILIARGIGENLSAEDLVKQLKWLTDKLEEVVIGS